MPASHLLPASTPCVVPTHTPTMYHVHVPTASQPRSLTAGGAIADRDEPPAVLLAVQRAREALEVCERLSARRVEKFLAHLATGGRLKGGSRHMCIACACEAAHARPRGLCSHALLSPLGGAGTAYIIICAGTRAAWTSVGCSLQPACSLHHPLCSLRVVKGRQPRCRRGPNLPTRRCSRRRR